MDKKSFIESELSRLLAIAKPNLVSCTYEKELNEEYVVVHCDSGYIYKICISANSLAAIVCEVFTKMMYK